VSSATTTLDEGPGVAFGYVLNLSNAGGTAKYVVSMEAVLLQLPCRRAASMWLRIQVPKEHGHFAHCQL